MLPYPKDEIAKAEAQERENRLESWLGLEPDILGIEVAPFTLRKALLLDLAGNYFINPKGDPIAYDCAAFLWVVSAAFKPGDIEARDKFFQEHVGSLDIVDTVRAIDDYLNRVYFDLSSSEAPDTAAAPLVDFATISVHTAASAYGWSPDAILDMPLRQLLQLRRCQAMERDPSATATLGNPLSDGIKAAWLEKLNNRTAEK